MIPRGQLLYGLVGLALAFFYYNVVYEPLRESRDRARTEAKAAADNLVLARTLEGLHAELEPLTTEVSTTRNLVSRVEEIFRGAGLSDRVVYVRSKAVPPPKEGETAPLEIAEARLDRLDLRQLVQALGLLSRFENNVGVRLFELRRQANEEAQLILEFEKFAAE